MERNLGLTKGLYFSQSILLALTRAGAERKTAYEAVQRAAMRTWKGDESFAENAKEEPEISALAFGRRSTRSVRSMCISDTSTKHSAPSDWNRTTSCRRRSAPVFAWRSRDQAQLAVADTLRSP